MSKAVGEFIDDVRDGRFPDASHSYSADGNADSSNADSSDDSDVDSNVEPGKPNTARNS